MTTNPWLLELLRGVTGGDSGVLSQQPPGAPSPAPQQPVLSQVAQQPQVPQGAQEDTPGWKTALNAASTFIPFLSPILQAIDPNMGLTQGQRTARDLTFGKARADIGNTQAATGLTAAQTDALPVQTANQVAQTVLRGREVGNDTDRLGLQRQGVGIDQQRADAADWKEVGPFTLYNTRTGATRTMTPEEMATFKAAKQGERGAHAGQQGDLFYGPDGRATYSVFNPDTQKYEYQDVPEGYARAQDSPQKYISKGEGDQYKTIQDAATAAQTPYQTAQTALSMIEQNPEIYFGSGGESVQELRRLGVSLGMSPGDVDNVSDADMMRTLNLRQAMTYVNATKGAVSDREMELFSKASPSLTKPREGNTALWKYIQAVSKRDMERGQFFSDRARKQPYADTQREWSEYINKPENDLYKQLIDPVVSGKKTGGLSAEDSKLLEKYGH